MNPIFVSTSLLIGSTIVNGACLGTMTYGAAYGGFTMAIGMCNIQQNGGSSGSYKHECQGDVLYQVYYSDNECSTPLEQNGAAVTMNMESMGGVDPGSCSGGSLIAADDCDYLMMYEWSVSSSTDLCGTAAEAVASADKDVSTQIKTKVPSPLTGTIADCFSADTTGQGATYNTQIVNSNACTANYVGDVLTMINYGTDDQCASGSITSTTVLVNNDPTAVATAETQEMDDGNGGTVTVTDYICRAVASCTSDAIETTTDAPTVSPTVSPSVSPSAAPTAAPTTATASTPSPTTASSSATTIQSSSIIALLIASFYVIIIA